MSLKLQEFSIEENFLTFLNQEHFFLLKSILTDTVQQWDYYQSAGQMFYIVKKMLTCIMSLMIFAH